MSQRQTDVTTLPSRAPDRGTNAGSTTAVQLKRGLAGSSYDVQMSTLQPIQRAPADAAQRSEGAEASGAPSGEAPVQRRAVQRLGSPVQRVVPPTTTPTTTTPAATTTTAPTTTPTTPPVATPHPRQADLDADKALIGAPANLADFKARIMGLKAIIKPAGKTSVALKIDKFLAAVPRLRAQLIKPSPDGYGGAGAAKATEWIDNRLAIVEGYLRTNFPTKAQAALDAIQASGTVAPADQLDPDWGCLVDFRAGAAAFSAEEEFSVADLGTIGGVFKVYDVGKVFSMMGPDYKVAWDTVATTRGVGTGQALFIQECKTAGRIVYAPAGEGRNAPFAGANADKVFSAQRPVTAFVGLARDATATTFADAIVKYQLQASYYPSGAMLACQVGEDVVRANWGTVKLGKPSIMNLLVFDENVYDETDRTFGHLADPADPTKPGANLELTVSGMPLEEFMRSANATVLT